MFQFTKYTRTIHVIKDVSEFYLSKLLINDSDHTRSFTRVKSLMSP